VLGLSLAFVTLVFGCGGDDGGGGDKPGGGGPETGDKGQLSILFSPMYSAYDGEHDFQLPVIVPNTSGVTFTAADPSLVSIENGADGAMLTMKKAGSTTITAKAPNGATGTAMLEIAAATPAQWELGNRRYNSSTGFVGRDAGTPTRDPNAACSNCHGTTANILDVEHTPQQTGGYSPAQLVTIFTMGQKPDGVPMRSMIPQQAWSSFHKWNMTDAEKEGIVVYLRSLAPKAQGEFDFGIDRFRGDGGFRVPDGGFRFPDGGFRRRDGGPISPRTDLMDAGI
jgi:hypothetical protein